MKTNILITSVGRRTLLMEYFVKEFQGYGEVHATDCSEYASALFYSDAKHIVPRIDDPSYLDVIEKIIKENQISGILSLIDPELTILSGKGNSYLKKHVKYVGSSKEVSQLLFDKYESYSFCKENNISTPKTFLHKDDVLLALNKNVVQLPIIIKPRYGSASLGLKVIKTLNELEKEVSLKEDMIFQEVIEGTEFGVDAYIDLISGEIIDIFIKRKISMRSGETDKAVSVHNVEIDKLVRNFLKSVGVRGPVDIDILEKNNKFYILESNPRFGGGYPHAYECGCNFPKYILNNLRGVVNNLTEKKYEEGIVMMKHDRLLLVKGEKLHEY